jgi:hypothetical protein
MTPRKPKATVTVVLTEDERDALLFDLELRGHHPETKVCVTCRGISALRRARAKLRRKP